MYYLYDYEYYAFQVSNWSGHFEKWYTPMQQEDRELIRKLVDVVQGGDFRGTGQGVGEGELVRADVPVRFVV